VVRRTTQTTKSVRKSSITKNYIKEKYFTPKLKNLLKKFNPPGWTEKTMKILINTNESVEIGNEVFPTGEWRHLDDAWVEKNAKALAEYPDLKEAQVVRENKLSKARRDYGIDNFDLGLKQAADLYGEDFVVSDEVLESATKVEEQINSLEIK